MRLFSLFLCIALVFSAQPGFSNFEEEDKNPRILILLDGSSSMLKEWTSDKFRFEAAADIIARLMDSVYSVNKNVEFALRVYGHQHPTVDNNCFDTRKEVSFSKDNFTQMSLRLAALHPLGVSPIAYSLEQAAENDLVDRLKYKYSLILITDGGESCDGNICKVAQTLLNKKIDFKPYILSLVDYAPLKSQYDCLGDFLMVSSPEQVDPVVGKIVDAYKRDFIQPRSIKKLISSVRTNTPSALKVKTPSFTVKTPTPEPVVKKEPKKETPPPPPPPVKKPTRIVVEDVKKEKVKEEVSTLPTNTTSGTLPQRYSTRAVNTTKVAAYTPPVPEAVPPRAKQTVYKPMQVSNSTTIKKKAVAVVAPKPIKFSVEREEAKETSLEIFFWDGKGRYYETAPEVVLRNPQTGEIVHKFQRTVDAYGNPRPQMDVPPGLYDLTITGKRGYVAEDIEVKANNKNRSKIVVTPSTLKFIYFGNPERPVKEFSARVSKALVRGPVNKQFCTEELQYEPGNYHIEINTNPISHRNTDLDFGVVVEIGLYEPGKVVVMNPNGYPKVEFRYEHGDMFETFRPIDVKGNKLRQEFLIKPGRYKVAYIRNLNNPNAEPIIKDFIIKSNTISEVTLD